MNVIITAGGEPDPKQPLYEATHGGHKAMLDINGKPMIQWVLDAMSECADIENVVVVGLAPETDVVCAHPLTILPDQGSMLENIRTGAIEVMRMDPNATHAVLASSDIPALRAEMVDWLLAQAQNQDQDVYYTVIERATMEQAFPTSKRTYVHLKNLQLCGGDLHCFRLKVATEDTSLWKVLIDARKKPLRQASLVGYDTLFFLMLRQLSLKDAEATVSKRMGLAGRALLCPYAEIGMDVDKPFQLEIMREHISRNQERYAAPVK